MTLKAWSLSTSLAGWLTLGLSFVLTRVFDTGGWQVVIPLTVHLFGYLVLGSALVLSLLWMIWLGRWQEDMGVALINCLLAGGPVVVFLWSYFHQNSDFNRYVFGLMWTGQ